ncbi:MAG: hypothetical protein R2834_11280 [Rhodothermales bacterium]
MHSAHLEEVSPLLRRCAATPVEMTFGVAETTFVSINTTFGVAETTFVSINTTCGVAETTFVSINTTFGVAETTSVWFVRIIESPPF